MNDYETTSKNSQIPGLEITPAQVHLHMPTETLDKIDRRLGTIEMKMAGGPKKVEEIQKVEVINPTPPLETLKAEVTNFPVPEPIIFPVETIVEALQKVQQALQSIQKVQVTNPTPKVEFPGSLEVNNLPIGEGNIPKKANPSKYVNVRLTDGERFYKALDYAIASAGGGGGKVSPASIGEILNIALNASNYTQIVFSGPVIAFEIQNRSAADMLLSNDQNGRTYWTIKAGTSKALTMTVTNGWWLLASTGTPTAEVLGIR